MSLTTKILEIFGLKQPKNMPYWLNVSTKVPQCTYYFGPFDSSLEAKALQAGYIEDLIKEDAQGIHIELEQRSQPEELTVCQEDIF